MSLDREHGVREAGRPALPRAVSTFKRSNDRDKIEVLRVRLSAKASDDAESFPKTAPARATFVPDLIHRSRDDAECPMHVNKNDPLRTAALGHWSYNSKLTIERQRVRNHPHQRGDVEVDMMADQISFTRHSLARGFGKKKKKKLSSELERGFDDTNTPDPEPFQNVYAINVKITHEREA
ncbi:hypothetical protein HD554DRAFT_2040776 [Boletus coccyginus]|nr:hypothetical protein HD554DRAFT_2040776 [Boletus coccyginus]